MEEKEVIEQFLIKRFECSYCKSFVESDNGNLRECPCKKGVWTLLSTEFSPENIKSNKIEFSNSYSKIIEILDYYMDLSDEQLKLIAIWILGTYLHETFSSFPILFINATKGSGKSRLLELISHLSFEGSGMVSTQPTEAVLFRSPPHHTLCFDEFENIGSKDKAAFRQYMNATYKKGGIVQRTKKIKIKNEENYIIENFEPYKPIALANIWGMEDVLGDRCLTLILQKSNNPLKTKKIQDFSSNYTINAVKRTLKAIQCSLCSVVTSRNINISEAWNIYLHYTLTTYTTLTTLTTLTQLELKDNKWLEEMFNKIVNLDIDGRNLELIFPLLITARLIDEEVFFDILEICKKIVINKKDEELAESKDITLIDFISSRLDISLNYIPVSVIVREFKEYLMCEEENDDKWLNSKWMGRALKRLDLILDKRRVARGNEVILNVTKAKENIKMFKPSIRNEGVK